VDMLGVHSPQQQQLAEASPSANVQVLAAAGPAQPAAQPAAQPLVASPGGIDEGCLSPMQSLQDSGFDEDVDLSDGAVDDDDDDDDDDDGHWDGDDGDGDVHEVVEDDDGDSGSDSDDSDSDSDSNSAYGDGGGLGDLEGAEAERRTVLWYRDQLSKPLFPGDACQVILIVLLPSH
jgi:hypothetical protein